MSIVKSTNTGKSFLRMNEKILNNLCFKKIFYNEDIGGEDMDGYDLGRGFIKENLSSPYLKIGLAFRVWYSKEKNEILHFGMYDELVIKDFFTFEKLLKDHGWVLDYTKIKDILCQ